MMKPDLIEEYDRRLVNFTQRWREKFPEEAEALWSECQASLGLAGQHLEPGYFKWLTVELLFRDAVAKRNNKTLKHFLEGAA